MIPKTILNHIYNHKLSWVNTIELIERALHTSPMSLFMHNYEWFIINIFITMTIFKVINIFNFSPCTLNNHCPNFLVKIG